MENLECKDKLEFRGGVVGLFVPFLVLFLGIMTLALTGKALPMAFWVPTLAALLFALLLSKDLKKCAEAIIQGMASEMVAIMLLSWFLAGIVAQLLKTTELVNGLIWLGTSLGLNGMLFPMITFLIGCIVSTATGTAIGSIIALGPILFPVGVALGGSPQALLGAIVCGAYFGDNIAPVSDTTIASAYTQGVEVASVVRTRLRYAFTAALVACVLFLIFGNGGDQGVNAAAHLENLSPKGLVMIVVPVILIFLMFRGVNLIVALMSTGALGILIALAAGLLAPSSLLIIDMNTFTVSGLIIDGINSLMDISVFAFLLMGLVGLLDKGGLFEIILEKSARFTTTPRNAEITVTIITILLNILTVASTIVIIMVGPLTRKLLNRHKIVPERRANILDAVSAAAMCLIPYSFGPLLAYLFAGASGLEINFSLLSTIPYMFHGWALLAVMIFGVVTGWGRRFMDEKAYQEEKAKLAFNSLTK